MFAVATPVVMHGHRVFFFCMWRRCYEKRDIVRYDSVKRGCDKKRGNSAGSTTTLTAVAAARTYLLYVEL